MSKTPKAFKSSLMGKESRLVIEPSKVLASESFYITHETVLGDKSFNFHNTEAPALALAMLEAAGVEPDREPLECQVSLGTIVADLQDTIRHGEALAAEAEAQAKLEAEALELMNVRLRASGTTAQLTKATVDPVALEGWLAVARRAREINKETPNA